MRRRKVFLITTIIICIMLIPACVKNKNNKYSDTNIITNTNNEWLIGKWSGVYNEYFIYVAEVTKLDNTYYISISRRYNDRFPLAETESLELIIDGPTAEAYYEDDGNENKGLIHLNLNDIEKSFSISIDETYSNGPTIRKLATYGSEIEMSSYQERKLKHYKYYDELDEYYDLLKFLRSNIWIYDSNPSIEWSFPPSGIAIDEGYLYENGKPIGLFDVSEKMGFNQLSFSLLVTSENQRYSGSLLFTNGTLEIHFDDKEEILIFK